MKLFTKLFYLLLTVFLISPAAFAETKSFVSEGKYVLGCLDSQKDAKSLALIDAKKQAMDKAANYLAGLPEVKAAKLTSDQLNVLATLMLSVDVLSEARKQTAELSTMKIKVRSTLDSTKIKDKLAIMHEYDYIEPIKEMQNQLATLQNELAELKAKQTQAILQQKVSPDKEQKDAADVNTQPPPTIKYKISAPMEVVDIRKSISNEEKQKYENVMKKIFALDALEKGYMALADSRWNDAQYSFGKAIELNPALVDAYARKSYALYNLKQSLKALTFIDIALQINAQSFRSLGIRALILKDQPGKIRQALASVNEAVRLKSDNAALYWIRGEVYSKMGKTTLARKDFTAACNLGSKASCKKMK